jgi:hypothetical protein
METNIHSLTQELFIPLPSLPILVCSYCQSAVRISQVITHLRYSPHSLSSRTATQIHQYLPSLWPQLLSTFDDSLIPNQLPPFDLLPVYQDGIQCQRTLSCRYICRTTKGMKEHWRVRHQWRAYSSSQSFNPSSSLPTPEEELREYTRPVTCQRFYRQGPHSHYFAVIDPVRSESAEPERTSSTVDDLFDQLEEQHQQIFQPSDRTVETVELDEATPWLRRTRWSEYLAGQLPGTLHSLIEPPEEDPLDPLWAIHQAMANMARTAQQIAKRCGHLIRVEVVRTEIDQAPHTPLQAYMDLETITRHIAPWQQIVCFFARTQYPVEPSHPAYPHYRFNHRQRKAWQALWSLATRSRSPDPYESDDARTSPASSTLSSPFHF